MTQEDPKLTTSMDISNLSVYIGILLELKDHLENSKRDRDEIKKRIPTPNTDNCSWG